MVESRNTSTTGEAQGVLAPLARAAMHVGWCIGFVGSIEEEELTEEQKLEVRNDLNDALGHLGIESFNDMLEAFVGPDGLADMVSTRNDMTEDLPTSKDDITSHLQTIGDNIAVSMATLELRMTGNEDAQAGRNF